VLAATHDGELVELLAERYAAFHFGDAVADDGLVFDHRLRPGPASTRNAIALLRLHGAPASLVRDALACAAVLDAERGSSLKER
jgi:DNA mismatch repair ATPase MutS